MAKVASVLDSWRTSCQRATLERCPFPRWSFRFEQQKKFINFLPACRPVEPNNTSENNGTKRQLLLPFFLRSFRFVRNGPILLGGPMKTSANGQFRRRKKRNPRKKNFYWPLSTEQYARFHLRSSIPRAQVPSPGAVVIILGPSRAFCVSLRSYCLPAWWHRHTKCEWGWLDDCHGPGKVPPGAEVLPVRQWLAGYGWSVL